VHLGASNDEPEAVVERVMSDAERELAAARMPVSFAKRSSIAALMTPELPELTTIAGMLVWTLDAAALARAPGAPALVQRLLRCMHVTSSSGLQQCVYVLNGAAPPAAALVALIAELGVELRAPVPEDRAVLAEVHRPGGVIISGLLGAPLPPSKFAAPWARDVNVEKDGSRDDREQLASLEHNERQALAARLALPSAGATPTRAVDVASRLRRLLVAVLEGGDSARPALFTELGARELPLLIVVDQKTRAPGLMSWPGGFQALPVYADKMSLLGAVRDLKLAPGSFGVNEMKPSELFSWAAGAGTAVAIGVFDDTGKPQYVRISPGEMRALGTARAL